MANKFFKNLKLGLAGIVLAGGLNGCSFFKNIEHGFALKKYSPLTTEQKDSLFKDLSPEKKEYLKKVYLLEEKDLKNINAVAHTHGWDGTLCLSKNFEAEDIFHESAHVKNIALDKGNSDFTKKWKEVADFKYGRKNTHRIYSSYFPLKIWDIVWKDKTSGSKNGCLAPYSAEHMREDVAEFVGCLSYDTDPKDIGRIDTNRIKNLEEKISKTKLEIDSLTKENNLLSKPSSKLDSLSLEITSLIIRLSRNIISYNSSLIEYEKQKPLEWAERNKHGYPLFFADTTDPRYQKKIDLLKEYDFLTKEEHEKLSEDLGSLNYLLKE